MNTLDRKCGGLQGSAIDACIRRFGLGALFALYASGAWAVVAEDDTFPTREDQNLVVPARGVLANDTDDDNAPPLEVVSHTVPTSGSVVVNQDGSLTYSPAADWVGSDDFDYTVRDGNGEERSATVEITVTPVNDAPSFTAGPDQTVAEDSGALTVPGWASAIVAGPADESGQTLNFAVGNDNPALFATAPAVAADGTLTFAPAADASGSATVTVTLSDNGGVDDDGIDSSAPQTFTITVTPVNDAPSFTAGPDQTVAEDSGALTVPGWASAIVAGPADESGQTLNFAVGNDNPALFATAPAVAADGTLTFAPAADASGSATVTVTLSDNGGVGDGGSDSSAPQTFTITVTPVNDAPSFTAGPDQTVPEDAGLVTIAGWALPASAGPADEVSVQSLTFEVSGADTSLFATNPQISSAGDLSFEPAENANGSTVVTVLVRDNGGVAGGGVDESAPATFTITVTSVNDVPQPVNDVAAMDEDTGPISIAVLANDASGDGALTLISAGVAGDSQSPPVLLADQNGDPITNANGTTANGTVTVTGNLVEYLPKPNFYGVDFFDYTVQDPDGDTATARVSVTVNQVNDAPSGPAQRSFSMLENGELNVEPNDGLLFGAFDVDGTALTVAPLSLPTVGSLVLDNVTGAFSYTPPVNFTGDVTFDYRLSDGIAQSEVYQARIAISAAPPPPPAPPAGEVAVTFNLSNVPLEQSTSVPPNVIVMMDDSGSMDWNMSVTNGDTQGGFVMDNAAVANSGRVATTYYYLWDLPNNIFGPTSGNGRILPTPEELEQMGFPDNQFGVWRARNAQFNRLYYNPEVNYTPWAGLDSVGVPYTDADPVAIRLNPRDPGNVFDILANHRYPSDNVPRWDSNGGRQDRTVETLYIPHYYTTPAAPPLAWDDPHLRIEIRDDGSVYPGGPEREDCAADDGDPMTCSYAQEIQNFANFFQYYRTREYAAKNGLGKVIADLQDIRIGYETLNAQRSEPVRDMNDLPGEGNKRLLLNDIYATNSSGGTPLRRALDRAGDIFAGERGTDPLLPAPEGFCQQNFTLLFSDGFWNGGDPSQQNEDADGPGPFDGGVYADGVRETLADVAMYFYENDLRPAMEDLVPASQRDVLGAPPGTFGGGAPRMHQHMKTYTVAFGLAGTVDVSAIPADPGLTFNWPDPEAVAGGKLDDMVHAALNGRGQFLSAVNPQELQRALESAFLEFTQAASSTSAAAFNSTSLQEGTLLFRGFYDLRDFTGELSATRLNPDGTLQPTPEWQASEQLNPGSKLPANRVLVTFDPVGRAGIPFRHASLTADQQAMLSGAEVDFLRGVRSQEQPGGPLRLRRSSDGLLGDIVNSSPVFVGTPRGLNRDQAPFPESDLFSDFIDREENRLPMVYVGANDGMLHGFRADTGEELFGFVPNKIIDNSQNFHNDLEEFTSPLYRHKYFVDLSPRISDAYVRPSTSSVGRSWNTVLLGGLGAGGKGYFALNVTDPESDFTSETNASDVVLWEFTDADDTSPNPLITDPFGAPVKDLGYALSLPTLAMSNVPDGDGNEWVAIFGNGPNSTAGVAKLFVLFMDRGLNGWGSGDFVKLDTGRGVPIAPEQLAGFPNGLGTPALVDVDLNGTVDWVYAGDRLGNLYRFDLCARDPVTGECSTNPGDWTVTRLFTASYDEGGIDRLQPILGEPLVIKHPTETEGFLVIFGTGSFITRDDADNEEIQSIYAIWDRGESSPATAQPDSKQLRLVEQTLTNVVDDSGSPVRTRRALSRFEVDYEPDSGSSEGTYGWFIDLDVERAASTTSGVPNEDTSGRSPPGAQFPGEKAIRRLLLRNGAIITTTVLPSLDEFSCFGARPGAILIMDSVTGGDAGRPIIDFDNDGVIDENDLVEVGDNAFSAGLLFDHSDLDGALVDLSTLGGEGNTDWLFACGGNDCLPFRIEPPDEGRTGRLSWRELIE